MSQRDADSNVTNILTMQQIVVESTANSSFTATLVLSFAGLSLLLAALGLYGVLAYLVTQRSPEIGIRMGLGAERERVLPLVLRDGLRPALTGLWIGMAASAGVTRLSRSLFYATSPLHATVFASVIVTLLMSATAACILPAWRAAVSIQYMPFGLNRCGHYMTWDANLFDSVLPINWRRRQQ
jgi:putative ABC transport system permease protein